MFLGVTILKRLGYRAGALPGLAGRGELGREHPFSMSAFRGVFWPKVTRDNLSVGQLNWSELRARGKPSPLQHLDKGLTTEAAFLKLPWIKAHIERNKHSFKKGLVVLTLLSYCCARREIHWASVELLWVTPMCLKQDQGVHFGWCLTCLRNCCFLGQHCCDLGPSECKHTVTPCLWKNNTVGIPMQG